MHMYFLKYAILTEFVTFMCWMLIKGTCFDAFLQLAGVHSTTLMTLADGTFDLEQLESKIRHGYPDAHYPRSRLVCVENTHNIMGGRVLPVSFLQQVRDISLPNTIILITL